METNIVNSGSMSFDFCSGYAPDCEFKEYCPCLEIWNEPLDIDIAALPNNDFKIKRNLNPRKNEKDL